MIFTQLVQANLSTKALGKTIEYYQILESTNAEAWELIEDGAEHGTVVITDNQTAGKGRRSNSWTSSPDRSLTFSVIVTPENIFSQTLVPLAAGIAASDAMKPFGISPALKWPNDILINGKKAGGILCESKFRSGMLSAAVIGIGLNVNEELEDFPEALSENATSMFMESGSRCQRERVLAECLDALEHALMLTDEEVIKEWTKRCGHIGKQVSFSSSGESVSGIFIGLDESGSAVVKTDGKEQSFSQPMVSVEE